MNDFLDYLYEKEELKNFHYWGSQFWKSYAAKRESNFAQQGYEDKGCGHIKRIISNAGDLLQNYCNCVMDKKPGKDVETTFRDHLEPNLIMFFTAVYLHDIGMNFPGIFEALKEVLSSKGEGALHISEIIHNYHHYGSFIVLLELNNIEINVKEKTGKPVEDNTFERIVEKFNNEEIANLDDIFKEIEISVEECPYLRNIPGNILDRNKRDLVKFKACLKEIYKKYFSNANFNDKEFFIILAILCLLHQEVNPDDIQSILRKFRPYHDETVRFFDKWWAFFNRAREWTVSAARWLPTKLDSSNKDIFPELITVKKDNGGKKSKLDLLLVEALLQYGDKTEITIARLSRNPRDCGVGKEENDNSSFIPLENFKNDIKWDNKKGFMCTNMAKRIISNFARFRACRFIPLFLVKVDPDAGTDPPRLDIVLHYFRFSNDKEVFPILRYHNEKDFYDLKFLEIIRVHIPVLLCYVQEGIKSNQLLDIKFSKMEEPFPIAGLSEERENMLSPFPDTRAGIKIIRDTIKESGDNVPSEDLFPYTSQNREAIFAFSQSILNPEAKHKTLGRKEVFYESCDLLVPSSFELMAVLNLFMEEE